MRIRSLFAHVALLTVFAASQAQGQRVIDLTSDLLDRFLKGADAEQVALGSSEDQLKEIDTKLKEFRECKKNFELATGSGGKLGMAARIALRAKCGASDEDGIMKERNKITEGPTNAGARAASMKTNDYVSLKEKITAYMQGERMGFSQPGLDLLKSREADLSKAMGMPVVQPVTLSSLMGGSGGGSSRGSRMSGAWTSDYAWEYIGQLFALQYASGAAMFEEDYKPGEWTRWEMTDTGNKDESQTVERAFLALQPDSAEWWRTKTISTWKDGDKVLADTVIMEALYKPTSEWTKELVRVRAKLPGNKEAQELLVPQGMGMINYNGAIFGSRPTKESIEGATVGTEKITTKAGAFTAKHIRFGAGGGNLDWWLSKEAPGGWVKFTGRSNSGDEKDVYTMEMIAKGTGAKSELGVIK